MIDLIKNPKKGERMEKLLKGRGILLERREAVSLGVFPSWGVADVTTVTFNYIIHYKFPFPAIFTKIN